MAKDKLPKWVSKYRDLKDNEERIRSEMAKLKERIIPYMQGRRIKSETFEDVKVTVTQREILVCRDIEALKRDLPKKYRNRVVTRRVVEEVDTDLLLELVNKKQLKRRYVRDHFELKAQAPYITVTRVQ